MSRHFLNVLRRRLLNRQPFGGKQVIRLNQDKIADLDLWDLFFQKSHIGILINLLTIRHPTSIGWSDSCPFGLGGFTMKGKGGRIQVPKRSAFWGDDSVNNVHEFLGMGITRILLLIKDTQEESYPCHLALGDKTSAIGWLFKLGRINPKSRYYTPTRFIARHVAQSIMESRLQLAGQHLQGQYNDGTDLLSFEGEDRGKTNRLTQDCPPNDVLTHSTLLNYPQLVPENFKILPLPPKIAYFACAAMQTIESSWTQGKKKPTENQNKCGNGGSDSSKSLGSVTPDSIEFLLRSNCSFSNVSLSDSEKGDSTGLEDLLVSVQDRWWH